MAASTPLSQMTPRARPIFPPPSSTNPPSTIRPILRKPGGSILGVRKRSLDDGDGGDDDDTAVPSSPTKKRKTVMFNESLNVVKQIGGSRTVDEAKRDIMLALDLHDRHDSEDYDRIKELFAPQSRRGSGIHGGLECDDDEPEPEDALAYVVALTGLAKRVDRKYPGLIKSVLRCAWLDRDDNFARAYIQLMAALSTAHGSILAQVLSMMVDKFTKAPPTRVPGFAPVNSETKKERLHLGLRYLLELFPAGGRIILNLVESKFPYTEEPKAVHMTYIDHLLQLKTDRPELERDIMELILSRLVKLDVEMTLDLENEGDETTVAVMKQLAAPAKPDDDGESDADSVFSDDNDDDDDEEIRRVTLIKSKLETLDATMDLLFSIYTPIFENPDSAAAEETFQDLLSDFSNVILPNLKSRHTQYLLFKFAMKSHQLMDLFIGTLFNLAFESNRSPAVKQAAVGYLASFTARGAQLDSQQVQTIAKTFLNYIDHYRATHAGCRGPDVRRYGQYYAYFQGLLYIFCFRWRDLIDRASAPASLDWDDTASFIGLDLPWVPWLKARLQANIASKLNPLKCCSPIIVEEFARLSHHLRLLYIYPQIEKNKNVQLSQFFTNSYATGGALRDSGVSFDDEKWTHLEACFPFDPFQLPVSKRWLDLDKTYISWQRFAILDREDETDAEVETDAEIDDETGDEVEDSDDEEDDKVSIHEDTTTDEGGNER